MPGVAELMPDRNPALALALKLARRMKDNVAGPPWTSEVGTAKVILRDKAGRPFKITIERV